MMFWYYQTMNQHIPSKGTFEDDFPISFLEGASGKLPKKMVLKTSMQDKEDITFN